MNTTQQLSLFPDRAETTTTDLTSTFVGNMSLEIHRWFRYSAGFSGTWAREVIEQEGKRGKRHVLDPFAGSGTVLLESELVGSDSYGVEAHPFVARIAKTKLEWRSCSEQFGKHAKAVLEQARKRKGSVDDYPSLVQKCYERDDLQRMDTLRRAWLDMADGSSASELTWLALISILRECSPVGTAQWQYILPNKRKAKKLDPYDAFWARICMMAEDMRTRQKEAKGSNVNLIAGDARTCDGVPDGWADVIITSPPYVNNYDYADATRLEMSFMGEIAGWGDLQDKVRRFLVRSCTQHVAGISFDDSAEPLLEPIRKELVGVVQQLEKERHNHGGKKPYHTMIGSYFSDMANVWVALRRASAKGSTVCFVVGDSAPYGIYVPVDEWLGKLAVSAGFKSYSFEKTRERNTKWKNRKHRVPLHEGRLWIKG